MRGFMGNFARLVLFCTTLFAITACMPSTEAMLKDMYNVPSYGSSKFDGSKYINLSNMSCEYVGLELYQDTYKSQKGIVLLKAGTFSITNIDGGKSLWIKLDGDTYSFEPVDNLTEHGKNYYSIGGTQVAKNFSNRSYIVPEKFIRKAAESKEFLVKVIQLNKKYIEGQCSPMSLEEARDLAEEKGISQALIKKETLETANMVTATKGFQKFVKMMDTVSF